MFRISFFFIYEIKKNIEYIQIENSDFQNVVTVDDGTCFDVHWLALNRLIQYKLFYLYFKIIKI
jgi:hypothetical protein